MESQRSPLFLALLLPVTLYSCLLQCRGLPSANTEDIRKLYIVYMGEKQHEDPELVTALHHDTLASVLGSKDAALDSIVYSYKHGFSGFAAMITVLQAKQVSGLPGVRSVTQSRRIKPTTTRSWDFLGLSIKNPPSKLLHKAKMGDGIIIGVIDTGVWPESKSFRDDGLGPIPSRWKGTCQTGQLFNASHCNRKLIGARWYDKAVPRSVLKGEYRSARAASNQHGTHTASTAAGSIVKGRTSFFGLGAGVARGGAPRARVAVYKVLWGDYGGDTATLVAAIDDAVGDGVDVMSLSLAGGPATPNTAADSWASLHAVKRGISVVYGAGNDGPRPGTLTNALPWVITVAASTIDRSFPTVITLGDNSTIVGQAVYYRTKKGDDSFKELYYNASSCDEDTLNATEVRGKIALCNMGDDPDKQFVIAAVNVFRAGGAGLIFARYTTNILTPLPDLPYVVVDLESRFKILDYAQRTSREPLVKVSPTRSVPSDSFTPRVAAFSSRGPSAALPAVLKPDIAAPGVQILAAVKDSYEFMSGTSMATPHMSGVVALLKCLHPTWSPAAIKSAIVTTASTIDQYGIPIVAEGVPRKIADPFDYGSGNINPDRAVDPGLVYDINPRDYEEFKCFWDESEACKATQQPMYHLNLPSIAIPNLKSSVTIFRTVTNVGAAKSIYKAIVESPPGINIEVMPKILQFDDRTKVQRFKINFTTMHKMQGVYTFGSLTWVDGIHTVRIPIAIRVVIEELFADVQ
uniref:Cucumisin n=2 Tax=Anthurium amnicola TaxID=1678845 RepID=A0A1D1Y7R4_9ARAE